ncbi:MAG: heme exporter protein CcmD [Rudaea sp.]
MADFFSMGGYGAYVWSAYFVFFAVLLADALTPLWQRRRIVRELVARLRREVARNVMPPGSRT